MPKKAALEYAEVYRYLSRPDSRYDPECSENRKRVIRRFSVDIVLEDGHLFYTKVKSNQEKKKWIKEKQEQQQVLESVHVSGDDHFDSDKTKENLDSMPVYWPTMHKDVGEYINKCEKCQKTHVKFKKLTNKGNLKTVCVAGPSGTEMEVNELTTSRAPPLTVDNVLNVIKRVNWRSFGNTLAGLCNDDLDDINDDFETDEARLEAVVKYFLRATYCSPSWRKVHWSLCQVNPDYLADPHIKSYAEPLEDKSLTIDKVTEVMEMVKADRITIVKELFVPESLVKSITRNLSTTKEKTRACIDIYLSCYPYEPSWKNIAKALFKFKEIDAAREARTFYHENDDSLTVDNVTKVMELVLDKRIMLIWKELKVPESLVQMRAGNVSTTNEKRGVYVELYLNYHPEPSWVNIAGALYGYQDMAAAAEAKKFYHKNEPSLTVDNLVGVMRKVTPGKENRSEVWQQVLEWNGCRLYCFVDNMDTKKITEKEKLSILAGVYINIRPESSWIHLVTTLYNNGELAAAEEAKSFLQNGAPSTASYIKVASSQPGGSSDDPSVPPPAKFRRISVPLDSGVTNNEQLPTVDCRLTIANLKVLRSATAGVGEKINVIKRLAPKWTDLGDLLAFDDSSSKLDDLQSTNPDNPEACCRAMFKHWIEGNGEEPCTWSKLIELLRYCDQEDLANEIEAAFL